MVMAYGTKMGAELKRGLTKKKRKVSKKSNRKRNCKSPKR